MSRSLIFFPLSISLGHLDVLAHKFYLAWVRSTFSFVGDRRQRQETSTGRLKSRTTRRSPITY
ncbi:hypothetical protein Sjap_018106 [Stephania japonica]|uniref:Uncharacterized protein n=1 Tax=Stephania japonica TaxID=461633 RepID=A0AAP0I7D0_9MAGN